MLVILAAVVVFLTAKGWKALQEGGIHFITDPTWSPDSGHFGAMPLLARLGGHRRGGRADRRAHLPGRGADDQRVRPDMGPLDS